MSTEKRTKKGFTVAQTRETIAAADELIDHWLNHVDAETPAVQLMLASIQGHRADLVKQLEEVFHACLSSGDAQGVELALRMMAVVDPHRAQLLLDMTRFALDIAGGVQGG